MQTASTMKVGLPRATKEKATSSKTIHDGGDNDQSGDFSQQLGDEHTSAARAQVADSLL